MYQRLVSFAVLSLGAAAVAKVATSAEANEELKLSDPSPFAKYLEREEALSNALYHDAPLPRSAKPKAQRADPAEMMQTVVELDEPLVQAAPAAPPQNSRANPLAYNAKKADDDIMAMISGGSSPSSLISSKRSTDVSSSLSGDVDLVSGLSGIDLSWGQTSTPSASVASTRKQNSNVNPYLEGIDFKLPAPAAVQPAASLSTVKIHPARKTKMLQRVVIVDEVDQSKLKGAFTDWISAKKPAEEPVVHEQQQEEQQSGQKEDPMAMDNYNAWAHRS